MPVGDDIKIPDNILVRCPLRGFTLIRAAGCDRCTHFAGMSEQMNRPGLSFQRAYAVRCTHPVDRELFALED
jgi:hypothetical protein